MTEKWKELLKAPQGQRKVFILLAVLGIALVLLSGNGTAGSKNKSETTTARDYDAYVADLEGRLQKTVASMDGVCTGGDDPAVREKITTTVASLFGIPTNRISVSKLKGE